MPLGAVVRGGHTRVSAAAPALPCANGAGAAEGMQPAPCRTARPCARRWQISLVMLGLFLGLDAGCRRAGPEVDLPDHPELEASTAPGFADALAAAEDAVREEPTAANWRRLGELYHANGYYSEARDCYAATGAEDIRVTYYEADLARQLGDPAAELDALETTVRTVPDYAPAWLWLAEARYKSGDMDGARAAYTRVLTLDPDNPHAQLGLAREQLRTGEVDTARRRLDQLIAEHPSFSSALALQARLLEQAGGVTQAAELRERSRGRKDPPPEDPWLDALLPHCHDLSRLGIGFEDRLKAGLAEEALAYLARMEAVAPEHWQVRRFRALVASRQGRGADAVTEYEAALAADGDPDAIYPALVDELVRQERVADAERQARSGLQAAPRNVPLHTDLAELLWRRNEAAEAERWLRAALQLSPHDVPAQRLLGWILWQAGRREEARPYLESLRRLVPGEVAARAMLGELLIEQGQPEAALEPLREAHAVDPNNADVRERLALAWLRIGNQHARAGRTDAGLDAYDAAITVSPANLEAHTNKARVLLATGRPQEALAAFASLAAARRDDAQVYLMYGDVAQAAGRHDLARQHWQTARSLLHAGVDPGLRTAVDQRLTSPPPNGPLQPR